MNIAVICSDERMQQVYNNLMQDFTVDLLDETTNYMHLPSYDAMVFPMQGIDAFGYVTMHGKAVHIPQSCLHMQGKHCLLFAGMRSTYTKGLLQPQMYYLEEEQLIQDNAVLTAEGVLHELIACTQKSIYDIVVDVVGYGHCGKAIYAMLKRLKVTTRVIRRNCEQRDDMLPVKEWNVCGDIIIHTATGVMISERHMQIWNSKPIIIDISSEDLIDRETAKKEGIAIMKAKNLPGRFSSYSAGNMLADYIRRKLIHGT